MPTSPASQSSPSAANGWRSPAITPSRKADGDPDRRVGPAVCRLVAGGDVSRVMMAATVGGMRRRDDSAIYAEHSRELVRFATVLAGPSGAEDLVADAVLRAFNSPAWASVENPRAYLYRAVLNAAHQAARSDGRRRAREQRVAPTERIDPPAVRAEVLAAVARLSSRQRAVVFLTYWQDRTSAEIAIDLGIDRRTVQRELATARARLAEELR